MPFVVSAAILCDSLLPLPPRDGGSQMACSSHYVIDSDSGATLVSALFSIPNTPHHKHSISFKGASAQITDWVEARK